MHDHFAGDSRTQLERMLAGDLYIADDPELTTLARRAMALTYQFEQAFVRDLNTAEYAESSAVLRELLGSLGQGGEVRPPLRVDYGRNIHVGERVFINYNLTALDVVEIRIGDDCLIGPNVQLLTPTHPIDPQLRADKLEAAQPITLGNNVWLGGGVIVCPGVTIGDNTVVGAGSVVAKDLPANVVAVGSPARIVRGIDSEVTA